MTTLREWQHTVHQVAREKGWWDRERSFPELIALMHSELSEALEEYRRGGDGMWYRAVPEGATGKPEGIAVELADCVIRILDACAQYGVDLEEALARKVAYNRTRPYRHGNKQA